MLLNNGDVDGEGVVKKSFPANRLSKTKLFEETNGNDKEE
jgi:hypothetical protein